MCMSADEYAEFVLSTAPPLSDEQKTRLAELLKPVRVPVHDATASREK
jgi:hypothetical protein